MWGFVAGPHFFNRLGGNQTLGSTGLLLEQSRPSTNVMQQVHTFIKEADCPFVPRDLLENHLQSDASVDPSFQGNVLQALKCRDECVLLFALCGKDAMRVGSAVCRREAGGRWRMSQHAVRSRGKGVSRASEWPASASFQRSVNQLSAVWANFSANEQKGHAIVAARSCYHVHFSAFSIEDEEVQFLSTAISNFDSIVVHVTWNPHITGEAAVLLDTGVVCLFDVQICGSGNQESMVTLISKGRLKSPIQRLSKSSCHLTMVCHSGEHVQEHDILANGVDLENQAVPELQQTNKKWWQCDYGWLPQTLLLVSSQDVFLVDVTNKENLLDSTSYPADGERSGLDVIASVGQSTSTCTCSFKSTAESIVAFCKAGSGERYQFTVATEHHLLLFDIRQSQTPILRWEHGMREEPPEFIIMCPLSKLRSFDEDDELNGRAILAASRKSGDMRVFCYGSDGARFGPELPTTPKKPKICTHAWGDEIHAWSTPSKMYAPQSDVADWRDVLRSCQARNVRDVSAMKSVKKGYNIVGIALLSHDSQNRTLKDATKAFTILQLTGHGKLLAQMYKASNEIEDPSSASMWSPSDATDARPSTGNEGKDNILYFEELPAFLKYIRTGSVLLPSSERPDRVREKQITSNDEGTLTAGHKATFKEAIGKNRTGESSREKSVLPSNLDTHLVAMLKDLKVPMTMYEVARLVLGVALPEELARSPSSIPPDLISALQNVIALHGSSRLSDAVQSSLMYGAIDVVNHTFSSSRTRKDEVRVPIPLLLEASNIQKAGVELALSDDRISTGDEPTEGGQELLAQSTYRVKEVVEELVRENVPAVISLAEPTAPWENDTNANQDADSNFMLYTVQAGVPGGNRAGHQETQCRGGGTNDVDGTLNFTRSGTVDDLENHPGSFGTNGHRLLVAKRPVAEMNPKMDPDMNSEQERAKRHFRIDPKLCPIQLSFTSPDEELEQDELTALEDLQADFLQWQQGFVPYKSAYTT